MYTCVHCTCGAAARVVKASEEVTVKDAKDVSEEANVENDDTVGNIRTLVMSDVHSEYVQPSLTVLTVKKASEPNEDQESDVEIDISHTDIPQLDSNLETFNQYASASTISLSQLTALMEKENKQQAKEREKEQSKDLEDFKRNLGLYTRLEPFTYCSFSPSIYAWKNLCRAV